MMNPQKPFVPGTAEAFLRKARASAGRRENPLEADIESKAHAYARSLGILSEKFKSPNKMSVPDRMFSTHHGFVFFIEFKRRGKKPTPKQREDHAERRRRGFVVLVHDDLQGAKASISLMKQIADILHA